MTGTTWSQNVRHSIISILDGISATRQEVLAPFPADRVGLLLDPPNFISPALYPKRDEEIRRMFRELGGRIHLVHLKDMKLNASGQSVDLPGPGGGEMNYPLVISGLRQLDRPITCIIDAHQGRNT